MARFWVTFVSGKTAEVEAATRADAKARAVADAKVEHALHKVSEKGDHRVKVAKVEDEADRAAAAAR